MLSGHSNVCMAYTHTYRYTTERIVPPSHIPTIHIIDKLVAAWHGTQSVYFYCDCAVWGI